MDTEWRDVLMWASATGMVVVFAVIFFHGSRDIDRDHEKEREIEDLRRDVKRLRDEVKHHDDDRTE